jgi:phosphate/sulfate permease
MDNILIFIVFILLLLSVLDLVVGVSNDAVNFLNSAIGSKAAPRYVIMIIASLGIVIGAIFSGGMMEVARKGVFFPQQFYLMEIMTIFLAVMLTDVILLDFYNTFGLPTSTTVSLVFELLGAAVAVSMVKIFSSDLSIADLNQYINAGKALAIISGIFISIGVAFVVGGVVMYATRLIFSFNYKPIFKYIGSIWGGIALTSILYFIVMKGIVHSSVVSADTISYIKANTLLILLISFVSLSSIFQLLISFFNFNLLRYIVLAGTFALALSFAGNDLVNFIGVFMAGLKSYQIFASSGIPANELMMGDLAQPVSASFVYLLIAGTIMTITLWLSKKARTVTETEINLARQDAEGGEKFGSNNISRNIVRGVISANNSINKVLPAGLKIFIEKRFNTNQQVNIKENASFDMLRASVNLTVASILISSATSLKLPLSTTYVTFMVAMASSLADRAWGRDSAVYRVTGVLTVISGWLFTALIAFTAAFIVALFLSWTGVYGIFVMVFVALYFIIKSNKLHSKKESDAKNEDLETILKKETIVERCIEEVNKSLRNVVHVYNETIHGLSKEDRKLLKKVNKDVEEINLEAKHYKNNVFNTLNKLQSDYIETGHYYVQVIDYLREIAHSLSHITKPAFDHIDNNHKGLLKDQVVELKAINYEVSELFSDISRIINEQAYDEVSDIIKKQQQALELLNSARKKQIKRIKNGEAGTRNSNLYLGILNETKNLLLQTINLVKAERDFIVK